jgi:antitoxin component of MazEF toxin-antitoxin module
MGRRKLEDNNIRKLSKTGGGKSVSVTLPIEMVRELKWREKQKVVVKKKGDRLIIEDWKR